jgi:uncharacterized protein (DUF1810 family)
MDYRELKRFPRSFRPIYRSIRAENRKGAISAL